MPSPTNRRPASPAPSGGPSSTGVAACEAALRRSERQLVAAWGEHRAASQAAFEHDDQPRANRLRQIGANITFMASQIEQAKAGLHSRRELTTHLETLTRVYDSLSDLRRSMSGDI